MNAVSSIGLGLDIAGGTIIAVGLLGHPSSLARRASSFFGESPPTAAFMAESRADAEIGIPVLVSGFLGQLVGLAWSAEVSVPVGALLAAGAALVPLAFWHAYWRSGRSKALAIEIAHWNVPGSRDKPKRLERPVLDRLAAMAAGLGEYPREGEEDAEYVERVFGVTETLNRHDL
jgi:hypothetical protein